MNPDRKRRRQAQRRLKRDVLQNHMVLRGWVPVKCGKHYGIAHVGEQRLVLRVWGRTGAPTAADTMRGTTPTTTSFRTGWNYSAINVGALKHAAVECSWLDLQAQWMRGLRSVAIQKGWL